MLLQVFLSEDTDFLDGGIAAYQDCLAACQGAGKAGFLGSQVLSRKTDISGFIIDRLTKFLEAFFSVVETGAGICNAILRPGGKGGQFPEIVIKMFEQEAFVFDIGLNRV
ncbi:MAG TPA: hypothetical protein DDW55_15015 [Gammaproteobacteria bacterium]|nr:hypothetical protein [Gammaproteobacteria bacterium]